MYVSAVLNPSEELGKRRRQVIFSTGRGDHFSGREMDDEGSVDELVSAIIKALNAGVDASTPWSKPSPRSVAGFDQ